MDIFQLIFQIIKLIFNVIESFNFVLIAIFLTIFYHLIMFYFRDRKYIYAKKIHKDPDSITVTDLKSLPIVNIIVPAWKEGDLFRDCLFSIKNLSYPKFKAIINAGGNDKTLRIASDFKQYQMFLILKQEHGAERASLGKIRAINECLKYVEGGIIYLMDADSIISDEILLRMIYPIINESKDVVIGPSRPLKQQEGRGIIKYLFISRAYHFQLKFSRNDPLKLAGGTNTTLRYEVIKKINEFTANRKYSTDKSMGKDIIDHGYKIYSLVDYRARIYTDYPDSIKNFFKQRIAWTENNIIYWMKNHKINFLKFLLLSSLSTYILVSPLFLYVNYGLVFIGIVIFLNIVFRKLRRWIFFKNITQKQFYDRLRSRLFLFKFFFYIYIELIINFIIPIHLIYYALKIRKR